MNESSHIAVLLDESVGNLLNSRITGIYIDATLGGGSTSKHVLDKIDENGRVIGIDQDPIAIEISNRKLNLYPNFKAFCENYRALDNVIKELKIDILDGIIFDLGVSSMQLQDSTRGFSFKEELDSQLDMRMDQDKEKITAYDLIMNLNEKSLRNLFREYGEDRWAGRVAARIVKTRKESAIKTTAELAKLISCAIPKRFQSRRIHPATRYFQALRIEVNDELRSLKEGLHKAVRFLSPRGRIVVISYHSLEDRIVKHTFRNYAKENILKIITKKPIIPTEEEIKRNPRSRSAKMRVAEKI